MALGQYFAVIERDLSRGISRKRTLSYRLWGTSEDGKIEFESLTTETLEGALDVLRQSFLTGEAVCQAVNMLSDPDGMKDMEKLCLDAAKDGVSVVAIDVATKSVVGVAFNKLQLPVTNGEKSGFQVFAENCRGKSSKALVEFMIDVDGRVNMFKHYNVGCIMEVAVLSTARSHQRRRIGELVVAASVEIGKELRRGKKVKTPVEIDKDESINNEAAIPILISATMTSFHSQKIAAKLGFDTLADVSFEEFEFENVKFSEKLGKEYPKSSLLVAKRL
ncbi:uncharacterized protein LOC105694573 isoform X2 [Orussus abietinus]|uniref:uncharacterized protein LOC105694573 isoform X2 n=1 Tax=Orussus abietinus TaxID=222816 RepID=UPI00062635D2|nr:uncharacterized protein LOC105694573 isoform X2 [Orussus abietinus]